MCRLSAVQNCQQFGQLRLSVWKICQPLKRLELYVLKHCYLFQSLGLSVSIRKKIVILSNGWSYLFQKISRFLSQKNFITSHLHWQSVILRPFPHKINVDILLSRTFFYLGSCGWGLKLLCGSVSKQCNFDDSNLQKPTLRGRKILLLSQLMRRVCVLTAFGVCGVMRGKWRENCKNCPINGA